MTPWPNCGRRRSASPWAAATASGCGATTPPAVPAEMPEGSEENHYSSDRWGNLRYRVALNTFIYYNPPSDLCMLAEAGAWGKDADPIHRRHCERLWTDRDWPATDSEDVAGR